MNRKTIQRALRKKFNDFIDSLEHDNIKTLLRDHSVITGGAITSMLLGEEVNDIDIYLDSRDAAIKVAKYFVAQYNSRHAGKCDITIDDALRDRIRISVKPDGIAGDVPEYIDDEPLRDGVDPSAETPLYTPVFISENAITLSGDVQIIVRFYGDAESIHKNYDFVHCTNYWTAKDGNLVLRADAVEATLAKELRYMGSKYPLCSVIRTRKFIKRGWNINAGQYLKMCFQLSKLDLTDMEVLKDQLIGVDSLYFARVIDAIQKKDGDVDAEYLAEIIDRIF